MKLWLGNTALHELARHLQILGQTSAREPAEAPQRERRTVRVRLEFREDAYLHNAQLVEQVRTALRTPLTTLKWQDEAGPKYCERWVIVGDDDQPEGENAWGTHGQSLVFSFHYFIHTLTTNCLPATIRRQPNGATLDLGAILKWGETIDVERFHDQRDPRRKVMATLAISGRFQGNTLASLDDCRAGLFTAKDALVAELVAGTAFRLTYGVAGALKFDQVVRVQKFTADVDQVTHSLEWQLTALFTKTPGEDNYAWLEYDVVARETKSEGIVTLGLRGRVGASSETKARTALQELYTGPASLIPSGYVQTSTETTPHAVKSADGTAFTELLFDLEWRDTTTLPLVFRKAGGATDRDLGVVEKFSARRSTDFFDPLRSHRRRVGGVVNASGKIILADTLTVEAKQAELKVRKETLDAELVTKASIELSYGGADGIFPTRTVRVVDWDCQINRLRNCLEWSLSCAHTVFPNESDYALCEFRVGTRENKMEGTVNRTLSGFIGAPTLEAAQDRLTRLRAAVIGEGYVQIGDDPVASNVSLESDRNGNDANDQGDGTTFIRLDFSDEWQKVTGDLLTWALRITDQDDVKSGYVRTTYAGAVTARGATLEAATLTAETQAETLGAGKYPFLVSSNVTVNERLFQTSGGVVFVTVEFSYEYQRKGARVYLEVQAERGVDAFGRTTETVSGFVAAGTFTLAQAAYQTDVRAAYATRLLLNERTPTLSQQSLAGVTGAAQFDRYSFAFTVHVPKTSTETAVEYSVRTTSDLQNLVQTSSVSGRIFAANRALADTLLDTLLEELNLGTPSGTRERHESHQRGPRVAGGGAVDAFLGLDFTETYVTRLTGLAGVLECEVTEMIRHSGTRWAEKPLPGGASLFQDTGTAPGQRQVSGRVRGTTETACLAWARKCRSLLVTGAYEEPPVITTTFRFLPRTDGTPRGEGADVLVYEASFTFSEWLPAHPFEP